VLAVKISDLGDPVREISQCEVFERGAVEALSQLRRNEQRPAEPN
jgi:hypothetical protein